MSDPTHDEWQIIGRLLWPDIAPVIISTLHHCTVSQKGSKDRSRLDRSTHFRRLAPAFDQLLCSMCEPATARIPTSASIIRQKSPHLLMMIFVAGFWLTRTDPWLLPPDGLPRLPGYALEPGKFLLDAYTETVLSLTKIPDGHLTPWCTTPSDALDIVGGRTPVRTVPECIAAATLLLPRRPHESA